MTTIKIVKRPSFLKILIICVLVLLAISCGGACGFALYLKYDSINECRIDRLKTKITELRADKKNLEAQLKVANNSNDILKMENNARENLITNLQLKLKQDSTKIEKLIVEKETLRDQAIKDIADAKKQKDKIIGEKDDEIKKLIAGKEKALKGSVTDNNTIQSLKSERDKLKSERDQANKNLQKAKDLFEECEAERKKCKCK